MLADRANGTLTVFESLTLSGIGMLVVFLELILLAVILMLVSKAVNRLVTRGARGKGGSIGIIGGADGPTAVFLASAPADRSPCVPGVSLYKVDDGTAAVLMALVAHQSGIAPERLAFKSIRLIGED